MTKPEFTFPVRVYYEDTDAGGVVYYANYLKFMERARTEWLRRLGYEQDNLASEEKIVFAVRRVELDYHKPALFNEELMVNTMLDNLGKASITFRQSVERRGEILCQGKIQIACVDLSEFKPVPIPKAMYQKINEGSEQAP